MKFLKQLFCKHKGIRFVRNLHGDQINYHDGYRSIWECKECGKRLFRYNLFYPDSK